MKKIVSVLLALSLLLPALLSIAVSAATASGGSPQIDRIEVDSISIIEGTNLDTDYWYDDKTGEYVEYTYYYYSPEVYTVYFTDGTSQVCDYQFEYNGEYYRPDYTDDQSPENVWGVGMHTATFFLMDYEVEFTVNIIESPVERIEVSDVTMYEGANCHTDYWWDEVTGDVSEYNRYDYSPITATVYFKDGTSQVCSDKLEYNGEAYLIDTYDDQSPDNLWGLVKHTVTASLMGAETTFTVEIVKSPIERITAKDVTVIKDLDVLFNGEFNQYVYNPEVTVYFNDGTSQTAIGGVTYGDSTFMFSYKDNQSKFKKWGVGAHKATVSVSGVSCDFTVNVIENPVVSVHIPAVTVIEGLDGHFETVYDEYGEASGETFVYYTEPSEFTVNFSDGTCQTSDNGVITYNGKLYFMHLYEVDDQYETEWKAGETHKVNAEIMGFTQTYTVTVAENPYSAVKISGEHEFVITFDRKDGGTEIYTAADFLGIMGNSGECEGYLFTDAGSSFLVKFTFDTENGEDLLDSNLVLQIGKMTSAPLNGNKWIKVCIDSYGYYNGLSYIKPELEEYFNKAFNGYNGKITAENLDQLLVIAAHIGRWTGEDVESETGPDGMRYIVAEEKAVQELLYTVFGESSVDVTASSFYSADGKLRIPYLGFSFEIYEKTMVYKDGQYIITYPVSEGKFLTIAMDENAHITWIVFGEENPPTKLGDINGDGKINAVDSNLVKKIVLGTFQFSIAADMDGNGKLNSVDSYLLKHEILGN